MSPLVLHALTCPFQYAYTSEYKVTSCAALAVLVLIVPSKWGGILGSSVPGVGTLVVLLVVLLLGRVLVDCCCQELPFHADPAVDAPMP